MFKDLLLYVIQILTLAIFAQIVLSWLMSFNVRGPMVMSLYRAVTTVNEPLMRPLRRVIPNLGMIDITPMVAIIVLHVLREVVRKGL